MFGDYDDTTHELKVDNNGGLNKFDDFDDDDEIKPFSESIYNTYEDDYDDNDCDRTPSVHTPSQSPPDQGYNHSIEYSYNDEVPNSNYQDNFQESNDIFDSNDYEQSGDCSYQYQDNNHDDLSNLDDQIPEEENENSFKLKQAEELIGGRDAIMEIGVADAIDTLIHNFNWHPGTIVQNLVKGYTGFAQLSQLVAHWLTLSTSLETTISPSAPAFQSNGITKAIENQPDTTAAEEAIIMNQLSLLIKQRFNKTLADSLLDLQSEVPQWLLDMIENKVWRRTLIELYDQNRESALLGYCLRKISSMGHHKDISEIVGEAEYFSVFNDIIINMIERIILSDEKDREELLINMKRTCCSSEFMFFYSIELCSQIIHSLSIRIKEYSDSYMLKEIENNVSRVKRRFEEVYDKNGPMDSNDSHHTKISKTGDSHTDNEVKEDTVHKKEDSHNNNNNVAINEDESDDDVFGDRDHSDSDGDAEESLRATRGSLTQSSVSSSTTMAPPASSTSTATADTPPLQSEYYFLLNWRRKVQRIQQDLEHTQIWSRATGLTTVITTSSNNSSNNSNNSIGSGAAAAVVRFSIKLTELNSLPSRIGDTESCAAVRAEILTAFRSKDIDIIPFVHNLVQLILSVTEDQRSVLSPDNPSMIAATVREAARVQSLDATKLLRHPQVLEVLVDALMHPVKSKATLTQEISLLLALASTYSETEDYQGGRDTLGTSSSSASSSTSTSSRDSCVALAKDICEVAGGLMEVKRLCAEIHNLTPVISCSVLRWLFCCVTDREFVARTSYLSILPTLLQLLLTSVDLHPLHHPVCFEVLKVIMKQSFEYSERAESVRLMASRKDILDTCIHIIGSGYFRVPITALTSMITLFDATLVRHLTTSLLGALAPPYSDDFADHVIELVTTKSVRDAVGRHFSEEGSHLVKTFCKYILSTVPTRQSILSPTTINNLTMLQLAVT